ncbi:sensor histidine kinase [Paracoccus aurantiacus]|nr:HAMP domain-containing sensor histidine kinase [Paracoccus aurantiacus]
MLLRIFLLIWGTIFLTLVSFALFIHLANWQTPPLVRNDVTQELALAALARLTQEYGADQALVEWQSMASVFVPFVATADADCNAELSIADSAGHCLTLTGPEAPSTIMDEIRTLTLPLSFGALISAIAAYLVSRRMTREFSILSQGLRDLADGRLKTRITPVLRPRDPYMTDLANAFDHAASQLQSLSEGRQRLFHDISHEIRSPLARLQAAIALLEKQPQRYQTMLRQMGTDIGRLDHLVDEILTLARLEQDEPVLTREPLDIVDLLEPIIDDANFEGERRQISVRYEGPNHLPLTGNAEMLHRSFENVIRNALTYSPDKGQVSINARAEPNQISVKIADTGPGVPEEELANLFEPFVRIGDTMRAKGAGLGLAIASRGIELHGGTITGQNRNGAGLVIALHIPRDA